MHAMRYNEVDRSCKGEMVFLGRGKGKANSTGKRQIFCLSKNEYRKLNLE